MTPVMYLSDAFVGNGAEPWKVPSVEDLPDISVPNAVKGEADHCLAAGMDGYVSKPIRPRELLARIGELTGAWKDKLAAGFTNSASQSGDKLNSLIQRYPRSVEATQARDRLRQLSTSRKPSAARR